MSVHFWNYWMDFDICCFEMASLDVLIAADSRFKPVGGEIWYPSSQWERWSQKASYCLTRKNVIFSASEKVTFFRAPNRTSWTTQKAQFKNITRKRKHDEKYMRENSPKKQLFLEFCFAQGLARPKKRNYFAQSRFPKYRYFFDVRGQKTAKIRPPPRWVRRHDQNKYPRKGNMSSGEFPKKGRFFWDFSKWKLRKREFPEEIVI